MACWSPSNAAYRAGAPNHPVRDLPCLYLAINAFLMGVGHHEAAWRHSRTEERVARKFASLDHISSGRAGWNIVTSANEQEEFNFGFDAIPEHPRRYERAQELADVTVQLWDSWESSAIVLDPDAGVSTRRARGLRGPSGPDPAGTRPVPHRRHRDDPARTLRAGSRGNAGSHGCGPKSAHDHPAVQAARDRMIAR